MKLARKRRRESGECGSAIVETAMSMIILLTFLFAIMEGSFALYSYHFISDAAREGTRYAMVRGSTAGAACGASYNSYDCVASSGNIQSYVTNLGFPGINPGNMTVTPVWSSYTGGSTCGTPCNSPGNLITVTVQYSFPLTIPFVPAHTYALTSSSAMVISQ
jgi:Flp pilus assembly protein TadG